MGLLSNDLMTLRRRVQHAVLILMEEKVDPTGTRNG